MTASVSTEEPRIRSLHVWLVLAAVLAVMIGLAVWYGPKLTPQAEVRAPLSPCDPSASPCSAEIPGGGRIDLEILPRPIPVMEKIDISVRVDGIEAERVEVDFAGTDMNMGFNRFVLIGGEEGSYKGNGVLPVCIRDSMTWEATVYAETERGLVAAPFRFQTFNR